MKITVGRIKYISMIFLLIVLNFPVLIFILIMYPFKNNVFFRNLFFEMHKCVYKILDKIFIGSKSVDLDKKKVTFPNSGKYMYMVNHQTSMDQLFCKYGNGPFLSPVKKDILYIPIFGYVLYLLGFFFIDRSKKNGFTEKILDHSKNNRDIDLCFFPEGHRFLDGKMTEERLHNGGFIIAKELGLDIVPVYHNMMECVDDNNMEINENNDIYFIVSSIDNPIRTKDREIQEIKKEFIERMIILKENIKEI
jgi:1-acyl-sn-glycerol-3-phosphate acyltransferase